MRALVLALLLAGCATAPPVAPVELAQPAPTLCRVKRAHIEGQFEMVMVCQAIPAEVLNRR